MREVNPGSRVRGNCFNAAGSREPVPLSQEKTAVLRLIQQNQTDRMPVLRFIEFDTQESLRGRREFTLNPNDAIQLQAHP